MLITQTRLHHAPRSPLPFRQRGVTLFIALISLVVMTLASIGLMRSMGTSLFIAGNMAFKQSATYAGDRGVELAVAWLASKGSAELEAHIPAEGYSAMRTDPGVGQSWDAFWNGALAPGFLVADTALAASDNVVSYFVQRMCATTGPATAVATACSIKITDGPTAGNSMGAGILKLEGSGQVYYRITVRTTGSRNTISYIQTIVLL